MAPFSAFCGKFRFAPGTRRSGKKIARALPRALAFLSPFVSPLGETQVPLYTTQLGEG